MEGFDRLDQAIDRRFQIEDAFIQAMVLEFRRIQTQLNECIDRHPEDYQLATVGENVERLGERLGEQSREQSVPDTYTPITSRTPNTSLLPLAGSISRKRGGKRTRRR